MDKFPCRRLDVHERVFELDRGCEFHQRDVRFAESLDNLSNARSLLALQNAKHPPCLVRDLGPVSLDTFYPGLPNSAKNRLVEPQLLFVREPRQRQRSKCTRPLLGTISWTRGIIVRLFSHNRFRQPLVPPLQAPALGALPASQVRLALTIPNGLVSAFCGPDIPTHTGLD